MENLPEPKYKPLPKKKKKAIDKREIYKHIDSLFTKTFLENYKKSK
tara:strand:+ start:1492 stop:1629 length:138 start_codon:yes stop_codon:yes gene_type:complete